jgi:benzil reductase ((S)-benzoin forming)
VIPIDSIIYYINNAFSINPICKIENFEENQISLNLKTNIFFPVIFISALLNSFSKREFRILNITSGAAMRPIENWALYCSCKSFLNMFFKVLETEIKSNILIYNIEPGVIDTNMQQIIRDSEFPESEYFKNLKIENKLKSPNEVVYQILKTVNFLE